MCREAYGFKSRLPHHWEYYSIKGWITLKIETVAREDQQTRLVAELDKETLEKYMHQAARKVAQSTKIPGFRPGKAPYDLVRRMVGEERLQQEAVELLLDEVYPQVLAEADIKPSGPGQLEEIISYDPPTFAFIVPLQPDVQIEEYGETLRKEYAPEPITDEQVEQTVRRLQRSYSTAEPVERAAQPGDMVSFKLSAKRTQAEEGKSDTLLEQAPYQMVAGEDDEDQEEPFPYPGFAQELVGMSAEETKTITHTFSDESSYEDLRGQEAEFTIAVDGVKEVHLSELNDEFAQNLGEFQTMDDLRKTIRQQLEQNYQQQYDQNYYDGLIEELISRATVKYPPHMLNEEAEEFLHGVEHNLEHDRLDLDTYLKMREMDRETFIENEVKPAAEKRLIRSLVLEEFARREKIEVKEEEMRSVLYAALQQMQQSPELKKLQAKQKTSPRDMANSIAMNTVNNIFNQRLMSRLKAIATGKGDEPEAEAEATEAGAVLESDVIEAAAPEVDAETGPQSEETQAPAVEEPAEPGEVDEEK